MMSSAIEAGCFSEIFVMSSAMRVRGHGHWPYFASASSSIITSAAGSVARSSGNMRW